jgi:Na+-transporting NADH:ubiquinone oxidoreductase subunit F
MTQLLLSLLALSGLGALLAFFLEVADSYLGFYGECQIRINEGEKELQVFGGETLLSSLMDQGIFIPSACGGRGSCGYCKVKVMEGGGPLLPTETPYLEPEEVTDNVRLSCQIKVRGDIDIEIPPELFLIKEFGARVEGLRDLTDDIKELCLRLIEPDTITFKPGQYIQFQARSCVCGSSSPIPSHSNRANTFSFRFPNMRDARNRSTGPIPSPRLHMTPPA